MNDSRDVVLVTGSSGLIGSALIRSLGDSSRIAAFDRAGPPHPPPNAECVCVDLTSDSSVEEGFKRVRTGYGDRIASVVHLAAYYDFSGEPSDKYQTVTIQGTQRLLRALQDFEVEQFVFSSTVLVHAPGEPGRRIDEEWPLEPKWDYPKSKVETENLIRQNRGLIPAVLLRIAGVYNDHCHSIPIAHQIQRIYERQLTAKLFPGDIAHGQPFIHLDDLVDAIIRAIQRRRELPAELTLLLGEPETLSYDEVQRTLGRLIHEEDWETKTMAKSLAKTGAWLEGHVPGKEAFIKPWMIDLADDHYELDVSRAEKLIGWIPRHSLRDALPGMVAALKADPRTWYEENRLKAPRHFPQVPGQIKTTAP